MAIDDPTAIPQSPEQLIEYMHEAETLWNDGRTEEAHTIYRSVLAMRSGTPESSLAAYRLALYLQTIGDIDGALGFLEVTHEPGKHDLEIALRAEMPDQAVDPSNPPQTMEACERYVESIDSAFERGDWTTVDALVLAYQDTPVDIGIGRHAVAQTYRGVALVHLGREDEARPVLEYVLANSNSEQRITQARAALVQIGVHVEDGGNPYQTDDSEMLLAGIAAFEKGDEVAALSELQLVIDSDSAGANDKARAHFYLGSMAYHSRRFDEARVHLHITQTDGPEPERGWATDMLAWRWQEEE